MWLLLAWLFSSGLGLHTDPVAGHALFTCEPISLRMCQDLPYNTTSMPNLLNHYDQHTAALAMEVFQPLVKLECSVELRSFLCALYAPLCVEYGRLPLPCRALCTRAKSHCHLLTDMFGLTWPEESECSRFPDCEEPYPRATDLQASAEPTQAPPTSERRDYGFWCPRELKVEPELGYEFLGAPDCSAPCPNMFFRREELAWARLLVGVASVAGLSATLFTVLTSLIDVTRFRYPERPIVFHAACHMMVSLAFLLGFLLGERVACNAPDPARHRSSTVTQGSHNKACTLLFALLYFSAAAGGAWWVVLTAAWFLAAVPKWGSEAIERQAGLFHALAWGVAGLLTLALLASSQTEGDNISGVCFVGLYDRRALRWFVLAPLGVEVALGVALLLGGVLALQRVRRAVPLGKEDRDKLVKFMIRMGVFSALHLAPRLALLACHLYEHRLRPLWESSWLLERCRHYHIPCPAQVERTARPDLTLFLIKYLMLLVVSFPSLFWVASKKTCFQWAGLFTGRRRRDSSSGEVVVEVKKVESQLCDPHTPVTHVSRGSSSSSQRFSVISGRGPEELPPSSHTPPAQSHAQLARDEA